MPSEACAYDVIGHEWAVDLLAGAVESGRIAQSYLISGPPHVGKTHLAMRVAAALNCTERPAPCGVCASCSSIVGGRSPDLTVIAPERDRIKIEQIRSLKRELALSPVLGTWRVCIIPDFQAATTEAANALLKTLEEPPSRVVMILTAPDPSQLLPTIVSRCQIVSLRGVPAQQIEEALVQRGADRDDAVLLGRLSYGRVGWAISALADPAVLNGRCELYADLIRLLHEGRAAKIDMAERLSKSDSLPQTLRAMESWWRDVALLQSDCGDLVVNVDYTEPLRHFAEAFELGESLASLRAIDETCRLLEANVNARLASEVLFLGWRQVRVA